MHSYGFIILTWKIQVKVYTATNFQFVLTELNNVSQNYCQISDSWALASMKYTLLKIVYETVKEDVSICLILPFSFIPSPFLGHFLVSQAEKTLDFLHAVRMPQG